MNTMLIERARSMLNGAGFEKEFQVEVVSTACYLINRHPTIALMDKICMEVWTSKIPHINIAMFLVVIHMFMYLRRSG